MNLNVIKFFRNVNNFLSCSNDMQTRPIFTDRQYRLLLAVLVLVNILVFVIGGIYLYQQFFRDTSIVANDPKFILAGWEYPDGYGEGISSVYMHENSTGSWVAVKEPAFFLSTDSTTVDVLPNGHLRLQPSARINHTLRGLSTYAEAKAIMRVSVYVTMDGDDVFSQQNLTLEGGEGVATPTTWWIAYEVILPFVLSVSLSYYSIYFTYEIYEDYFSEESTVLTNPLVAIGGNGSEYNRSWSVDGLDYQSFPSTHTTLDFNSGYTGRTNSMNYSYYGDGGSGVLKVWNGSLWHDLETITSETWYNGSYSFTDYYDENVTLVLTGYCDCDYLETSLNVSLGTFVDWEQKTSIQFWVGVPVTDWVFDSFLIFVGLVMIPASTLYFVKGGKDEISSDKVFFFIVAFMIGWALVVATITP